VGYAMIWSTDHFGFAAFAKDERFYTVYYVDNDATSFHGEVQWLNIRFYGDGVYNFSQRKLSDCEFGLRKEYRERYVSTILGIGYDIKHNELKVFVLAYI
jgi:hypothetical protein